MSPWPNRVVTWGCGAALALGAWLAGCAINPVSGTPNLVMMSENQEIELGRSNDPKIRAQFGVYEDEKLQAYVQQVGERIAAHSHRPDLVYRFTVIDTPDVNAFALPGGYIYITRGILAYLNSEAELAAVLGHEIGHVTARHSVRQYSAATAGQIAAAIFLRSQVAADLFNVIGNALLSGYGRDHELEADRLGAEYLARNGYDPDAMIGVIGVLKNQEEFEKVRAKAEGREPHIYHGVFASHPSADQRLQEVVGEAKKGKTEAATRTGRDEYLQHIDGLRYGDSPKAGVRYKSAFYHAELNFAVQFPDGWRLENSPKAVVANSPEHDAMLQLVAEDLNKRVTPEQYLKTRLKTDAIKNGGPVSGTTLPSYAGIARLSTKAFDQSSPRDVRAVVVYYGNRAYLFLGVAKTAEAFARDDARFLATAANLHALRPDERKLAEGLRVRLVRTRPGDTFGKLATASPVPAYAESVLRL
ncbi:MAG: M48 family metalloprotease, partial [Sulfurifustaceae bacterium]